MIVTALLNLIYWIVFLLTSPLRLLPDVTLPAGLTAAVATASGYISSMNSFLPVDTLLQIFFTIISIELLVLTYRLIVWVITKIPGISN